MESQREPEELTKEELVRKCKRLLQLAQKAKHARDECAEELKISKEVETRLLSEISALQEVLKASSDKQELQVEDINRLTVLKESNERLQQQLTSSESQLKLKNTEIAALQKVLSNLNAKISTLDEKSTDGTTQAQLIQVTADNEELKSRCVDYQAKLKQTEEKFALLEVKLVDFQNTYLEEKKKHAKLEALLGKLEEKTEKSGSDRSESREGLATVPETEEVESLAQKLEDALKVSEERRKSHANALSKVEIIEKELNAKNSAYSELKSVHGTLIVECLNKCKLLSSACEKAIRDNEHETSETKEKLLEAHSRIANLEEIEVTLRTGFGELEVEKEKQAFDFNYVIDELNKELAVLRDENTQSKAKLAEFETNMAASAKLAEEKLFKACDNCTDLQKKYENVGRKLQTIWSDTFKGKENLSALKSDVSGKLSFAIQENADIGKSVTQVVEDFARKLSESNSELLLEMNVMNQALKERGESISKLEEEITTLNSNASDFEIRHKNLSDKYEAVQSELSSLQTQLEQKEKALREMEEEIWRVRNAADTSVETLSTSTISRVDESQRLAELEGSFEERYNKLKGLALKLKKKVIELQTQLEQERTRLVGERAEFQTKLTSLQAQGKTLASLQSEYDALLDKSENERRETIEMRKSLNKARDESVAFKRQFEEFKNEQSRFSQEKSTFDMIKKELSAQISNLKKTIEKEQAKHDQWEVQKEQWERNIKVLEKELSEEKECHKKTAASLEEERHKQKKQSLLSLEMADYERTVTEMSRKLSVKDDEIKQLTANLETQRDLSKTLQESVAGLEARVLAEQTTTDASKAAQQVLQEELSRMRTEMATLSAKVADSERLSQERTLEIDDLTLQLSTSASEFTKAQEKLQVGLEKAHTEIRNIEEKRAQLQNLLDRRELELEELTKEFESYKVRAQSVLRQSQKDGPSGRQLDIEQELLQLRASYEVTKTKLEETVKIAQQTKDDLTIVSEEKGRLQTKLQELQKEVKELTASNRQLEAAEQRARDEGTEALRMVRVQHDTLSQCYLREIEDLKAKHNEDLESCRQAQQQAETALQLHVRSPSSPRTHRRMPSLGAEHTHTRQPSTGFVPVRLDRESLDVLMLEREACEGSESVDSSSPRIIPLEQLLQPQAPALSYNVTQLTDKLEKSESRIQHLTNLLSDAESDAARLEQLNQVLKEEIRRKERNVAREEHASNLEYLKNIVLKFATLPRGDERLRLVPVLNTILKLSREEEHRLCAAARGEAANASWGSYLGGMWQGS